MSLVFSSRDLLWLDFSLAVLLGFGFGTCFLELVDSALFWLDRVALRHAAKCIGKRRIDQ